MPSPSLTDIPLAIRSGPLLNGNVQQDRLYIPTSIPPGHVWKAQGYLKALVKQEEADRIHLNEPFVGEDVINVIATMPGINRPLDDFQLRSPLTIQYPLELLQPAYRQTVLIGDEFTVHWRVCMDFNCETIDGLTSMNLDSKHLKKGIRHRQQPQPAVRNMHLQERKFYLETSRGE